MFRKGKSFDTEQKANMMLLAFWICVLWELFCEMFYFEDSFCFSLPLQNHTRAWHESSKPLLSVLEDDGGLWISSLDTEWKQHLLCLF
jgi:hypothetical protein